MSLLRAVWIMRGRVAFALTRNRGASAASAIRPFSIQNKPGGTRKPDMALIRELREASGAPIVDCKNALAAVFERELHVSGCFPIGLIKYIRDNLVVATQRCDLKVISGDGTNPSSGKCGRGCTPVEFLLDTKQRWGGGTRTNPFFVEESRKQSFTRLQAEGVDGDIGQAFQWLRKRGIAKATSMADRSANEGLVGLRVDGTRGALVEVNSETDFVARNAKFQEFVEKVLMVALEKAKEIKEGSSAARELDVDELLQSEQPGSGEVLADSLAHLVAAIRENIAINRAHVLSLGSGQGVVSGYVHGAVGPGMGKNAALVALKLDAATTANDVTIEALDVSAKSLAMHVVAARPAFLDEASAPPGALEGEKTLLLDQARESGKDPKILDKMVQGRLRKYLEDNALVRQSHIIAEGNPRVSDHLGVLGEQVGGTVTVESFARLSVGERETE